MNPESSKIAMYFSGRIISYEHCIANIIKLKDKYNITFFCSLNLPELTDYEYKFFELLNMNQNQYTFENLIAPDWIYTLDGQGHYMRREKMHSHFYNNKKCIELIHTYEKENNINFDIIIKYRADIVSNDIFPILHVNKNIIYIPHENDHTGINDQLVYGDRDVMYIHSTLYDRIIHYCKNHNTPYHPESLTLKNIIDNNINIQRFDFRYSLDLRRQDNDNIHQILDT